MLWVLFHDFKFLKTIFACYFSFQLIRFKQNIVQHDKTTEVICPSGTTYLQYVGDNTDHDTATIDGKNTRHGLGSIAIANRKFSNVDTRRIPLPRDKKKCWSEIQSTQGIPMQNYHEPDKPALNQVILRPVIVEQLKVSFVNLLWSCSRIFLEKRTSWSGYMSVKANAKIHKKSLVTMLPVINLSATNMTALHSLLCFVVEQSKNNKLPTPSITFDQP